MRKSIIRMLVSLTAVLLANPVLAADRAHHAKQSNPAYWTTGAPVDVRQAATSKVAAKQQKLPSLPKRSESKAPVDYMDVEIAP